MTSPRRVRLLCAAALAVALAAFLPAARADLDPTVRTVEKTETARQKAARLTHDAIARINARFEDVWAHNDFRAAENYMTGLINRDFADTEIDGKNMILRKVRDIRTDIGDASPPRLVVLEDGRVGMKLPAEGTWTMEFDLTVDVDYRFLFFGYTDTVDMTVRIEGISMTVIPDIENVSINTLTDPKLRLAEIRDVHFKASARGEHEFVTDNFKKINVKLNAGIAHYIQQLNEKGAARARGDLADAGPADAGSPFGLILRVPEMVEASAAKAQRDAERDAGRTRRVQTAQGSTTGGR